MVRSAGVEPTFPASEADALSIELRARKTFISFILANYIRGGKCPVTLGLLEMIKGIYTLSLLVKRMGPNYMGV